MAGNDVFAHVVALHGLVDGVSVVDEEGDPLPVPAVGADTDVVPVAEDHNVPGLPLGGIVQVTGQHLGMAAEEGIQIADPAEVDVAVRGLDVGVAGGMVGDVPVHQVLQGIARRPEGLPDHVGAYPQAVVGIAAGVVFAFIVGVGADIGPGAQDHVRPVVHAVAVGVQGALQLGDAQLIGGVPPLGNAASQQEPGRGQQQQAQGDQKQAFFLHIRGPPWWDRTIIPGRAAFVEEKRAACPGDN